MGEGQPEYWTNPGERGVPDPQGERVMFQRLSKIKNDRYSWILAPKICEHRQSSIRGIEGRSLKLCCSLDKVETCIKTRRTYNPKGLSDHVEINTFI